MRDIIDHESVRSAREGSAREGSARQGSAGEGNDDAHALRDHDPEAVVPVSAALRHLLVFQLKLAADALRDFLLSPLSIAAFILDAFTKPKAKRSLYLRLMKLGRRSDRMINLFDEYHGSGKFTVDHAVDSIEDAVRKANCTPANDASSGARQPN